MARLPEWVTIAGAHAKRGSKFYKWLLKNFGPKPVAATSTSVVKLPKLVQAPSPNHSSRGAKVTLVVLHDTEGAYAGSVSWLRNPKAQASAHVVLREDGLEASQLVRWSQKAWACVNFNPQSLNLEMAGFASKGYGEAELDAAAAIVAYWCHLYDIPVRHAINGIGAGITFHQELGVAGGGHHDPGFTSAQKTEFIAKVAAASGHGFTPAVWGLQ